MTAELDALRAEVERLPIDEHWWVYRDSEGRCAVVWNNTPHMSWSAGDDEWCREECDRLNKDTRAGTLLAALSGFIRLTDASGREFGPARLALMLAHVRTEPLANACDLGLNDLYRVTGERDTARRDLEYTQGAIAAAVTRAQQAESTRDAAQARATACEERARKAEQQAADAAALLIAAERQLAEWRGIALQGADFVHGHAGSTFIGAWADAVKEVAEAQGIDPAAGTGDHEREPGRNGE